MKAIKIINVAINCIFLAFALSPLLLYAALAIGAWQFGGNLLIMAIQAINPVKAFNLRMRGWYTLVASIVLAAFYTIGGLNETLTYGIFISCGICAIWYTVICILEFDVRQHNQNTNHRWMNL